MITTEYLDLYWNVIRKSYWNDDAVLSKDPRWKKNRVGMMGIQFLDYVLGRHVSFISMNLEFLFSWASCRAIKFNSAILCSIIHYYVPFHGKNIEFRSMMEIKEKRIMFISLTSSRLITSSRFNFFYITSFLLFPC